MNAFFTTHLDLFTQNVTETPKTYENFGLKSTQNYKKTETICKSFTYATTTSPRK